MAVLKKTLRTCSNGHSYYKSTDCPTCPVCEEENKPGSGFLTLLAAPARRALTNNNITTLHQLATFTEAEILQLHGMGKKSLPTLQAALKKEKLSFKK
jgi:Bacterial RNA polymerase, alpha chain C terminal domain